MELPYDPANPHLGIDPKAIAPLSQGVIFTPLLFTTSFKIPKIAKQLEWPRSGECQREGKTRPSHAHLIITQHFKKERNCALGTVWTNPEDTVLREMSQTQKAFASARLHVGFEKKSNSEERSVDPWLLEAERWGESGNSGQRVQISSNKMKNY